MSVTSNEQKALDDAAIAFLSDPNLFGRIQKIFHGDMLSIPNEKIGIVGETLLVPYVFLCVLSSRPQKYVMRNIKGANKVIAVQRMPQMIIVVGTSRSGKTRACNTITWLFTTKKIGENSAKFLMYSPLDEYDVLYLQELFEKDTGSEGSQLRLMADEDGGLTFGTVEPNDTGKGWAAQERHIDAMCIVVTTTRTNIEEQFKNRGHMVNTDESDKQTKAILNINAENERKKFLRLFRRNKQNNEAYLLKHAIQMLDRNVDLHNTCAHSLNLLWPNFRNPRIRSDGPKLHALVCMSAYLHQYQRPYAVTTDEHGNKIKNIFAIPQDYYFALQLVRDGLANMYSNLDARQRELVPYLKELRKLQVKVKGEIGGIEGFTTNDMRTILQSQNPPIHLARRTLERRLDALVAASILEIYRNGRENVFKVAVPDEDIDSMQEIANVIESSGKFISAAQNESKEYFATLKQELGDNFVMPSEDTFKVYNTPQWFDATYTGDYKIFEGKHEAQNLGNFDDAIQSRRFKISAKFTHAY